MAVVGDNDIGEAGDNVSKTPPPPIPLPALPFVIWQAISFEVATINSSFGIGIIDGDVVSRPEVELLILFMMISL